MTAPQRQSTSIEFIVKPREDLYLEGALRRIRRVSKGEPYPCQMQKNQTFSCLFRHYAKHNGLKKEDLVFYFVEELLPDQMPESVHLMPQDEIWVDHRKSTRAIEDSSSDSSSSSAVSFTEQFRSLLDETAHSDVTFRLLESGETICAHKVILSARSEYFHQMFRPGGLSESTSNIVEIPTHQKVTFLRAMEFMYTNTVIGLDSLSWTAVLALLELANQYCLQDLQLECEKVASRLLCPENITRLFILSAKYGAAVLKSACESFMCENSKLLRDDETFRSDIDDCPGLLLFDALTSGDSSSSSSGGRSGSSSSSSSDGNAGKRRRITEAGEGVDGGNGSVGEGEAVSYTIAQNSQSANADTW